MKEKPKSKWFVITGSACAGKTTIIEALQRLGYLGFPEMARVIIDQGLEHGQLIEQIRRDEAAFQIKALYMKLGLELGLPREAVVLLDRGVPDSVAYAHLCGLDPAQILWLCEPGLYYKIFFLERLPFIQDGARVEDEEELVQLDQRLHEVYVNLGYEVICVPAMSLEQRVELILPHLRGDLVID